MVGGQVIVKWFLILLFSLTINNTYCNQLLTYRLFETSLETNFQFKWTVINVKAMNRMTNSWLGYGHNESYNQLKKKQKQKVLISKLLDGSGRMNSREMP